MTSFAFVVFVSICNIALALASSIADATSGGIVTHFQGCFSGPLMRDWLSCCTTDKATDRCEMPTKDAARKLVLSASSNAAFNGVRVSVSLTDSKKGVEEFLQMMSFPNTIAAHPDGGRTNNIYGWVHGG